MLNELMGKLSIEYIEKAKFHIIKEEGSNTPATFEVMINPSTITMSVTRKNNKTQGTGSTGGDASIQTGDQNEKKAVVQEEAQVVETNISMELIFDLVEAYDAAKSAKGGAVSALGALGSKVGLNVGSSSIVKASNADNIHLLNKEASCYLHLLEACEKQQAAMFTWGPMAYPVKIIQFDAQFTYFSSSGAPLRAKVKVAMVNGGAMEMQFKDNSAFANIAKSVTSKLGAFRPF